MVPKDESVAERFSVSSPPSSIVPSADIDTSLITGLLIAIGLVTLTVTLNTWLSSLPSLAITFNVSPVP